MDWELKTTTWDFSAMSTVDDDHDPHLANLVGSTSLGPNNNGGDFSVDLQLGRLGDIAEDKGKVQKGPYNNASSPSGSSKRARALSGAQNVTCAVDGCVADLSGCREYHRRHRVCERHSKTPIVSVAGKEQRFCQQCSRFQSLAEFDEEKRSCRKRLDGHNRRRRKPQPEAFYLNHGTSFSTHQGARVLQFGSPEAYTSSIPGTWPSIPKHSITHQAATYPNSSATNIYTGEDKRFPFLLVNEPERNNNHQGGFSTLEPTHHHLANNVNPHHRVHSLLSSPRPIQMGGSTGLDFGGPAQQYTRSPASRVLPQDNNYHSSYSGDGATMSLSPDDLLEKGASQVLPFSWK